MASSPYHHLVPAEVPNRYYMVPVTLCVMTDTNALDECSVFRQRSPPAHRIPFLLAALGPRSFRPSSTPCPALAPSSTPHSPHNKELFLCIRHRDNKCEYKQRAGTQCSRQRFVVLHVVAVTFKMLNCRLRICFPHLSTCNNNWMKSAITLIYFSTEF